MIALDVKNRPRYHHSWPLFYSEDDHYSEWMPHASWHPNGPAWQTPNHDHGVDPCFVPGPDHDSQWLKEPNHLEQFTKEPEGTACLRWLWIGEIWSCIAGRCLGLHPHPPPFVDLLVVAFLLPQGSSLCQCNQSWNSCNCLHGIVTLEEKNTNCTHQNILTGFMHISKCVFHLIIVPFHHALSQPSLLSLAPVAPEAPSSPLQLQINFPR